MAHLFCRVTIVVDNDNPECDDAMTIRTHCGKHLIIKRQKLNSLTDVTGIYNIYLKIDDYNMDCNNFDLSYFGQSFYLSLLLHEYESEMTFKLVSKTENNGKIKLFLQKDE
jgi:hypothetical protein